MAKEICISTTPHETRLAILENDELTEIYYERENEYTLAGSIYKGKVTRVLPGMQSAFVDVGLERDAFLYVTDFLEEQEDGADFESASGSGQRPRREGGREAGQSGNGRGRQPETSSHIEVTAEPDGAESSDDADSPSGTRRWRGRRGRRRGFRPRGQHEERPQLESPAAIEESISAEPPDMPEHGAPGGTLAANRILLPGESLSKYGGTPAETRSESNSGAAVQTAAVKTNYVAPKPSTLIETPLEWDGGLLMPGESLSRYRGKSEAKAAEPTVEVAEPESVVTESHVYEASPAHVAEVQLVAELPEEAPASLMEPVQEFTDVEAARPDVIAMPELPSPIHAEPERVEVTAHEPVAAAEVGEKKGERFMRKCRSLSRRALQLRTRSIRQRRASFVFRAWRKRNRRWPIRISP